MSKYLNSKGLRLVFFLKFNFKDIFAEIINTSNIEMRLSQNMEKKKICIKK